MQSLTVEESVATVLGTLYDVVEIQDENGNVLGYYAAVSPQQFARYSAVAANVGAAPNASQPTDGRPAVTNGAVDNLKTLESR